MSAAVTARAEGSNLLAALQNRHFVLLAGSSEDCDSPLVTTVEVDEDEQILQVGAGFVFFWRNMPEQSQTIGHCQASGHQTLIEDVDLGKATLIRVAGSSHCQDKKLEGAQQKTLRLTKTKTGGLDLQLEVSAPETPQKPYFHCLWHSQD